jgi:hypothetical protein
MQECFLPDGNIVDVDRRVVEGQVSGPGFHANDAPSAQLAVKRLVPIKEDGAIDPHLKELAYTFLSIGADEKKIPTPADGEMINSVKSLASRSVTRVDANGDSHGPPTRTNSLLEPHLFEEWSRDCVD